MGIKTKFNPMGGTAGVKMVTLTVVTTPSDATCTLTYNGQTYNTKTLSVEEGSTVAYSISATGYTTQSGSWTVSADTTQTIILNKQTYLLTVITSPANADCRLYYNGEYYYQKTLTVEYGATVSYYVYGVTGYGTKSGSWTITSTTTETVELSPILYTLTVSTNPSNATCTLTYGGSSYSSKSATVASGTVINYSVYHSTYGTTTGSITMNSNKTLTCTGASSTTSKYQLDSDLQILGSPSITSDGLMTNISASNYVDTNYAASTYMSETNYEIQVRFKFSKLSGRQVIIGNFWHSTAGHNGVSIEANGKDFVCSVGMFANVEAYGWMVSGVLATDTWYTVNFNNNNKTYTVDAGSIGTNSATTRKTVWSTSLPIYFGRQYGDSSYPARYATIDLKNSWVKSNGSYVIYNVGTVTSYYWNTTVT